MGVPVPDGETLTSAADEPSPSSGRGVAQLLALGGALLTIAAYRAVGDAFYGGFALPQGSGMNWLPPAEVSAFALFFVFGGVAWALLTLALRGTATVRAVAGLVAASARGRGVVMASAVAALLAVACGMVARVYLRQAVTSDDEHVYRFIGQTL